MFLRVHREHLAAPAFGKFLLDLLDQSSFLGIELVFWKVPRLGDDE